MNRDERGQPSTSAGAARDAAASMSEPGEPDEISLVRMVNVFLRHRRSIVGLAGLGALLLGALVLLTPSSYTSRASFAPQSGGATASSLAGLAQQFGVSIPMTEGSRSPQFYAELLRTRKLLSATVQTEYTVTEGSTEPRTPDLIEFFDVPEDEARDRRLEIAIEKLREKMTTGVGPETGVVNLGVTTKSAAVSRQIVDRMLELVNRFNVETRQTQAAAERRFLDDRVAQARRDLQAAEDSLRQFLERNRRYENSPALRFEYERLQRRVRLQQEVYSTLAQSYEQAKIEEVRNTPVITLVDPPETPARPDRKSLLLVLLLGVLVGGTVGTAWAFGRQFMSSARREEPDEYEEFARLRERAKDDLRTVWNMATAPVRGLLARVRQG